MTNLRNSAVTTAEAAEYSSDSGTPFLDSPERNTVREVLRHSTVCKWRRRSKCDILCLGKRVNSKASVQPMLR